MHFVQDHNRRNKFQKKNVVNLTSMTVMNKLFNLCKLQNNWYKFVYVCVRSSHLTGKQNTNLNERPIYFLDNSFKMMMMYWYFLYLRSNCDLLTVFRLMYSMNRERITNYLIVIWWDVPLSLFSIQIYLKKKSKLTNNKQRYSIDR